MQSTARHGRCALTVVFAVANATALGSSNISVQTIALAGDAAPGTQSGVLFSEFGQIRLNDVGQVALEATLSGPGVDATNDLGIWTGDSDLLQSVARSGGLVPGGNIGESYSDFGIPHVTNDGTVIYYAELVGNSVDDSNDNGVWVGNPGTLELAVRSGDPAPGTGGLNLALLDQRSVATFVNDSGQFTFSTRVVEPNGPLAVDDFAGYIGTAVGDPELVRLEDAPAPEIAPGVFSLGITRPFLNDLGQVAFAEELTGVGINSSNRRALWLGATNDLQLIARTGDPAPGTEGDTVFQDAFLPHQISDFGKIAFTSGLVGPAVNAANDQGLWAGSTNDIHLIARAGDPVPGTNGEFAQLSTPDINDQGDVVFRASVAGTAERGIWTGSSAGLSAVAVAGDSAPDAGPGAVFNFFGNFFPRINDRGDVLFIATLAGPGVDPFNNQGAWLWRNGHLTKLFQEGELFDVDDDLLVEDLRLIAPFALSNPFAQLNEAGQVAFRLPFTDGTSGVFVAQVPEPTSLSICLLATPCGWLRPSRRLARHMRR